VLCIGDVNQNLDILIGGIVVCDRWKIFENFLDDMGERPNDMTLGRIDNNEGYHPKNCR
jgi:hypothetical protein